MKKTTTGTSDFTIGLDLGDKRCEAVVLDKHGDWHESAAVRTTPAQMAAAFAGFEGSMVILEVGTHSPWVSRLLRERGFKVVVANPRRVRLIAQSHRKNDKVDAEFLARLGRVDTTLLAPVVHRGLRTQMDLSVIRARDGLVKARTALINRCRGLAKPLGLRIQATSASAFPRRARETLSDRDVPGISALLACIEQLSSEIRELDRQIELLAKARYPETKLLTQIPGVGTLTALCFILTIDDPTRFSKSRDVGAYLGLVPKQRDSGDRQPQLGISKCGDPLLRRLLVGSSRYILGPFGGDTDLRRYGERLSRSGSLAARNRAAVAVARKLAILLHRLWVTGEVYQPIGYGEHRASSALPHEDIDPSDLQNLAAA